VPPAPELTFQDAELSRTRVTVDGKFFRLGSRKFYPKGVTYGPFAPNAAGEPFPEPAQVERDLDLLATLGANLVRLYFVPPRWFLDALHRRAIKALVDVPWNKHQCFLDAAATRDAAREAVRDAARRCAVHPAVFALSIVNEIPADIVRWSGAEAVSEFLDELIAEAKAVDRELLCTFGNFPPTEFLRPRTVDFWCWNVYLHAQRPFENYLARLQMLADTKPLMLGEFGIDSLRETEAQQAEILGWQIETAFRAGCAARWCSPSRTTGSRTAGRSPTGRSAWSRATASPRRPSRRCASNSASPPTSLCRSGRGSPWSWPATTAPPRSRRASSRWNGSIIPTTR
jgi:beta-galactosidase/beta-glucuronidase